MTTNTAILHENHLFIEDPAYLMADDEPDDSPLKTSQPHLVPLLETDASSERPQSATSENSG